LLVMPAARALPNEEVQAIERFAENGGHVIADVAPGQFDGHGVPRNPAAFSELFAVGRDGACQAGVAADGQVRFSAGEEEDAAVLAAIVPDVSVQAAAQAEAYGVVNDTPLWMMHRSGDGLRLLLNHPLSYTQGGGSPQAKALRTFVRAFLTEAGIEPVVQVKGKADEPFPGEYIGLRYGNTDLAAVLRRPDTGRGLKRVRLRFPRERSVYNVLEGLHIVQLGRVSTALAPGEAALYAALPYEVTELLLVAPEAVEAGRRLLVHVEVKTQGDLPGEHIVHVDLRPVGGAALPYYAQNVICPGGVGETYIPLCLNEADGYYEVVARDVLTGTLKTATVEILTTQ